VFTAGLALARPRINSDGTAYYAMALSLVLDGDLDISNQRTEAGYAKFAAESGKWVRPFFPGFAVFYWPILAPAVAAERSWEPLRRLSLAMDSHQVGVPPPLESYCPLSHSAAILLGSMAYGAVALFFSYRICRMIAGRAVSIAGTTVCFLATQLVGYVFNWPSFSHALDAAVVTVSLWLVLRAVSAGSKTVWPWGAVGFAFGAAGAVRPANLPLVGTVAALALMAGGVGRTRGTRLGMTLLGSFPWVVLIGWFRWSTMGSPFATGYQQSPITWPKYALGYVLTSPDALLQWSPVVAFSVAGWILLSRGPARRSVMIIFGCFAVALGCWANPVSPGRHGSAFGARYFVQFLGLYSLGVCSFWQATRRLKRAGRAVSRLALGGGVVYSLLLVPLCWLETPDLGLKNKATAAPHEIFLAGLARTCHCPALGIGAQGERSQDGLRVRTKESLLDLFRGKWRPLDSPWLNTMAKKTHTRDIVPGDAREVPGLAVTGPSQDFRITPLARGLPCISSFWLWKPACEEVGARFDCWRLPAQVGAWKGKEAHLECGFVVFGEPGQGGSLVHAVLPPLESEADLHWMPDPRSRCRVAVQRMSWEQLDLLAALWAASNVRVAEGFKVCAEPGVTPTYHLGPRGDVWAWEIGREPLRWWTPRLDGDSSPALALTFAYRGDAALTLAIGDLQLGTVSLSGDDARFSRLAGANVWITAPEVRRRKREKAWSHRCLLIVTQEPMPVHEHQLTMSARAVGHPASQLMVLSYGDTWRYLRAQCLTRAQ
jgi:hypothetical protein